MLKLEEISVWFKVPSYTSNIENVILKNLTKTLGIRFKSDFFPFMILRYQKIYIQVCKFGLCIN